MEGRFRKDEELLFGADSPFQIKWGQNGRYLVTKRGWKKGDVLWMEPPCVALQSLPNVGDLEVCGRCFKAVGTFEEQMRRALKTPDVPLLLHDDREHLISPEQVACEWGCGVRYCSPQCARQDMEAGHALLCVGPLQSDQHPLLLFKRYAMQHNEIFLVAAKVYATVLMTHATGRGRSLSSLDEAIWPFSLLLRMPWPDCVVYKGDLTPEELQDPELVEFASVMNARELRAQTDKVHGMLREALLSRDVLDRVPGLPQVAERLFELMNADFFSSLIGMCEINCSAVSFYGPALGVLRDKSVDQERRLHAQSFVWRSVVEESEEPPKAVNRETALMLSEVLPYFDGIAVFHKISVMQHSCVPNVINKFARDWDAEVTAVRDIEAGEELVHSYIDFESSFEKRSRVLRLWGFTSGCECPACRDKLDLKRRHNSDDEEEHEDHDDDEEEEEEEEHSH
jgi:hypothetical protein